MAFLKMMYVLIVALLALAFSPDDPPEDPEEDPPEDPEEDPDDEGGAKGSKKPYKTLTFETKQDETDHYNGVFEKRHGRMKRDIKRDPEFRQEIADEIRAEQGDQDQKLRDANERLNTKVGNLEARIEELEGELETKDEAVSEAESDRDRYSGVIEKQWKEIQGRVPKHTLEAISDWDVLRRIDHIRKYPEILDGAGDPEDPPDPENPPTDEPVPPIIVGSPPSPDPQDRRTRTQKEDAEAYEASRKRVKQGL